MKYLNIAEPKSAIFIIPVSDISIFYGLRSLWIIPKEWMYDNPDKIWYAIVYSKFDEIGYYICSKNVYKSVGQ